MYLCLQSGYPESGRWHWLNIRWLDIRQILNPVYRHTHATQFTCIKACRLDIRSETSSWYSVARYPAFDIPVHFSSSSSTHPTHVSRLELTPTDEDPNLKSFTIQNAVETKSPVSWWFWLTQYHKTLYKMVPHKKKWTQWNLRSRSFRNIWTLREGVTTHFILTHSYRFGITNSCKSR